MAKTAEDIVQDMLRANKIHEELKAAREKRVLGSISEIVDTLSKEDLKNVLIMCLMRKE